MAGVGPATASRARAVLRDSLVFLAFAALTCAMTWPWVARIGTACADTADTYLEAWVLWWNYHAAFTSPLHLFDSNLFFPYRYTLAFTEHGFGIALPLFPLFALGLVTPLSAVSVAMLLSFALSGFGAFRLARTLTGSTAAAWVAGIAFGFATFHFLCIYNLVYAWAVWIPLLAEAIVLFVRERTWGRALWLGAAFLLSGLSVIHWMVLTALPLAMTAIVLGRRRGVLRDRAFWIRGGAAVGGACLVLLPFLLPYAKVARWYGMTRDREEVAQGSARLADWLHADPHNKLWAGFQRGGPGTGAPLFPGALPLLLAFAALLLARKEKAVPEALAVGLIWLILGFFGSLGMNFPFHRFLYETVFLFRSIRVPLRWAMVGTLGLALLAGLGAALLAKAADGPGRVRHLASRALPAFLALALLWELRVAPLDLAEGEPDPDEATRYLAGVPMKGGLVEIPAWDRALYRATLRAADHGQPLITAISGFTTRTASEVATLLQLDPIPPALFDVLEDIPTSYVVVRRGLLMTDELARFDRTFEAAVRSGRLRFVRRFPGEGEGDDLYAVVQTEPAPGSSPTRPPVKTLRERLRENPAGGGAEVHDAPRNTALPPSGFRAQLSARSVPSTLRAGEMVTFDVTVTNLGDASWPHTGSPGTSFAVMLSYHWIRQGGPVASEGIRSDLLLDLAAGARTTLNAKVQAPDTPGDYVLELDMVQEGVAWFKDRGSTAPQIPMRVE